MADCIGRAAPSRWWAPSRIQAPEDGRVRLEGTRKQALEVGRNRLLVTGIVFAIAFGVIAVRLVDLTILKQGAELPLVRAPHAPPRRADIVDRNGAILATSLPTASLYANPSRLLDAGEAADRLVDVLPGLDRAETLAKLTSDAGFVWLRRNLTPKQKYRVNRLGIPGLDFRNSERRVYPHGRLAAHVLGLTDVDGRGIAGVERYFDAELRGRERPLQLSIDIRLQALLHDELASVVAEFRAIGAAGLVLDAGSGEVLSMVSLPDFDPNAPARAFGEVAFNRATKGVYEMGSVFKLFNTAIALDSGTVTLRDGYDASRPIRVAQYTITDFHGKNRWLTVPEILVYSSNIGSAKMALDVGAKVQRRYMLRLGLLRPAAIELPEVGVPLAPARWRDINTMTISYGHGIAVSPLQVAGATAAVVNGGIRAPTTIVKRRRGAPVLAERVLSTKTSDAMRGLMRLVVRRGTGRKADVPGYRVGGKTGTADKLIAKSYRGQALISSFIGTFPMDGPRYVIVVMVDEPKGNAATRYYATGGWVAAPVVARLVSRMAPLLGISPATADELPIPGQNLFVPVRGGAAKARERKLAVN